MCESNVLSSDQNMLHKSELQKNDPLKPNRPKQELEQQSYNELKKKNHITNK